MKFITTHVSRCFLAGVVALLPIGGLVLTVAYLENTVAAAWPKQVPYYPGLGILAAAGSIYLVGLTVSTFIGRWLWRLIDSLLDRLPALGTFYQTLKQILGYGAGKDAIFQQVVLLQDREFGGHEVGLVTNRLSGFGGVEQLVIFVPGAPNPTLGRLIILDSKLVRPVDVPVSEALKSLVSVGKTIPMELGADSPSAGQPT
jgi:uncharacterized membrane protein